MPKIKIENDMYDKVKKFAEVAGYASVEEFINHVLEKELSSVDESDSEDEIKKRLQGLGYLS